MPPGHQAIPWTTILRLLTWVSRLTRPKNMRQAQRNSSKTSLVSFTGHITNKACFSIVAIHGLGGRGGKQWSSNKTNTWIQGLAAQMHWEVRIIQYTYEPTNIIEATYSEEAISSEASKLLQKLHELRSDQHPVSILENSIFER
jgi:hypothetical protein